MTTATGHPYTPTVDKVTSEMDAARRKVTALEIAVRAAENELRAAVEVEQDAVLAQVEQAVETRRASLGAAVESWATSRTELARAVALAAYLRAHSDARFKIGSGYLRIPRKGDGAPPPTYEGTLAKLRQDAEPPIRSEPPTYAQPLQPTVREIGVSVPPHGLAPRGVDK
jgi:hypothetical protein